MAEPILGGKILKLVKQRCQPHQNYFQGKLITIILFQPPKTVTDTQMLAQYQAAITSTNQKVKTFQFLGCDVNRVELPANVKILNFTQVIQDAANNSSSLGIIVQNPIPSNDLKLKINNIPSKLDIDGINKNNSLFKASATSEAVARLVESFTEPGDKVAVVGSIGFVGSGVVKLLQEKNINIIELDKAKGDGDGDIKKGVLAANIVVSATGRPNLITQDYLKPEHKLVLDAGFVPQPDGQILGDVAKDAYDIPQNLTPVPGGIGPTQMAVLLERMMIVAEIKIQPWNYKLDFASVDSNPQQDVNPKLASIQQKLARLQEQKPAIIAITSKLQEAITTNKTKIIEKQGYQVDWEKATGKLTLSREQQIIMVARLENDAWNPAYVTGDGLTTQDLEYFQRLDLNPPERQPDNQKSKKFELE